MARVSNASGAAGSSKLAVRSFWIRRNRYLSFIDWAGLAALLVEGGGQTRARVIDDESWHGCRRGPAKLMILVLVGLHVSVFT